MTTQLKSILGGIGSAREALIYADERPLTPAEIAVIRRGLQEAWDTTYLLQQAETDPIPYQRGLPILKPITTELAPAPRI